MLPFAVIVSLAVLASAAPTPIRSVIVIRHCDRAPDPIWPVCSNCSAYADDYAAKPFPFADFDVPAMECTARGMDIIRGEGASWLKQNLPGHITFIADNVTRDFNTTQALMEGMQMAIDYTVAGDIFHPNLYGVCPSITVDDQEATVRDYVGQIPRPPKGLEVRTQQVLGQGKMPPMWEIPDEYLAGYLLGGSVVGAQATEVFLLEYGAGVQVGWGNLAVPDMYQILPLHVWWMVVNFAARGVSENFSSNLLAHVLANLTDGTSGVGDDVPEPATVFYVGHDSDLMGLNGLLGLEWTNPPYPTNSTAPGSSLRFDLWQDDNGKPMISVNYYSATFENTNGNLTFAPARFTPMTPAMPPHSNVMPLPVFQTWVNARVNQSCVNTS